jgi:hypothetical protein
MMKANIRSLLTIILIVLPVVTLSCASPEVAKPENPSAAQFAVTNLDIAPNPASPGDNVTITATIKNNGETAGIYAAILMCNEQEFMETNFSLGPGQTGAAIFTLIPDEGGSYKFTVGEMSNTLIVPSDVPAGVWGSVLPPTGIIPIRKIKVVSSIF